MNPDSLRLKLETHQQPVSSAQESVALLDGGDQAYPRMLLAIEQAIKNVHLEVYSFSLSGVGSQFIDALSDAASRGVRVSVMIDGWGSAWSGRTIAATLRQSGCKVRIYNRLLTALIGRIGRNHRKILLVDDEVAFLGGINIGDENMDKGVQVSWADLAIEIRGPQCARLRKMFYRRIQLPNIESSLRIYLCGLGGGRRMRRRYLSAFSRAQESIMVAHGYFLPDPTVVRTLIAAARRGVKVCLLLAGRSDIPFTRLATRSLYGRLLAAGVVIHEWQASVLHAKVATTDGSLLLVGSFNLDPFSLANLETLVEVKNEKVVGEAESWIHTHLSDSRLITSLETGSRLQRWLLDPFGGIISRMVDAFSRILADRKRRRMPSELSVSKPTIPLRASKK